MDCITDVKLHPHNPFIYLSSSIDDDSAVAPPAAPAPPASVRQQVFGGTGESAGHLINTWTSLSRDASFGFRGSSVWW